MTARDAVGAFWRWFAEHEMDLFLGEPPNDDLTEEMLERLVDVSPGLGFEISSESAGRKELILTAYGESRLFRIVEALAGAAPTLPRWTVVALKPAMGFGFVHRRGDREYDPRSMTFDPLRRQTPPGELAIVVHVPGYERRGREEALSAVEIILITVLGEKAFGERITSCDVAAPPSVPDAPLPLTDLPRYLEWRRTRDPRP